MVECPKEGFWIFKETIHDWDKWKTTDEGSEDASTLTSAWRQYWIVQTRTCKNCGCVQIRTESEKAERG